MSSIDSLNGISIVTEQNMGNPIMLNAQKNAVLRQYYGLEISQGSNYIVSRATYGFNNGSNSIGNDPNKYITKPFDNDMKIIATYIHQLIYVHRKELMLCKFKLCHTFNHCTILNYHAGRNIKPKLSMGYHCDFKYDLNGELIKSRNTQVLNTPTVVITTGQSRMLKWRRMKRGLNKKGRTDWIPDTVWVHQMVMDNKHMLILNPLDETPHIYEQGEILIKYQHGNVSVMGHSMSIALVFRVVDEFCDYDSLTNRMITEKYMTKTKLSKNKHSINDLYESFDFREYNHKMISLYKDTIK
jgi:hypothetical protein